MICPLKITSEMELFKRRLKCQISGLLKVAVVFVLLSYQFPYLSAAFARVKLPEKSKQPNVLIILADDLGMIALYLQYSICKIIFQAGVMLAFMEVTRFLLQTLTC